MCSRRVIEDDRVEDGYEERGGHGFQEGAGGEEIGVFGGGIGYNGVGDNFVRFLLLFYFSPPYSSVQLRFFFCGMIGHNTALIASSNTVFSPFCVNAEHSRYLTAPISFAIASP